MGANAQFVIEVLPFYEHVWQSKAHNRPIIVNREADRRELVNLVVDLFQVCVHSWSAHIVGRVVWAGTVRDEKNLPRGTGELRHGQFAGVDEKRHTFNM
jgi:hypothetical protein